MFNSKNDWYGNSMYRQNRRSMNLRVRFGKLEEKVMGMCPSGGKTSALKKVA